MGLAVSTLYGWFFGGTYKVVMVGLDNAGKTTILYRLNLGDVISTNPSTAMRTRTLVFSPCAYAAEDQ